MRTWTGPNNPSSPRASPSAPGEEGGTSFRRNTSPALPPETLQGKTTQSDLLRWLSKVYGTDAAEQGYEKKAAVPIIQAEILQLLQCLHQKQASQTGTKELLMG
ncbi:TPA: hypothetical protein ACH3X2_011151 [Trebouxia sp. C0005]